MRLDDDPDALIVRSYWALAGWPPRRRVTPALVSLVALASRLFLSGRG